MEPPANAVDLPGKEGTLGCQSGLWGPKTCLYPSVYMLKPKCCWHFMNPGKCLYHAYYPLCSPTPAPWTHLLVELSAVVVTFLPSPGNGAAHTGRVPSADAGYLAQPLVGFPWQLLGMPTAGNPCSGKGWCLSSLAPTASSSFRQS